MATLMDYRPQLSLAERDRRYRAVRARLAERGLDVLLAPANTGRWEQQQADARYLSQIGGNATEPFVVLPREGEPTAFVMNRAGWWRKAQGWIADVRDCRNAWAQHVGDWLAERGYERARIGVAGLAGLSRSPDGIVAYGTMTGLQERFPHARFENATDLMLAVRTRKSAEEIAFLERSAGLVALGIQTMAEVARPGVAECEVYAAVWHTMIGNGGEGPALFFLSAGPNLGGSAFVPTTRPLEKGDVILNEIEVKYGGYAAQGNQPMFIGEPTPRQRELYDTALRAFERVLAVMAPGVTMGHLMDTYQAVVAETPFEWGHPLLHARGLGDDTPVLLGDSDLERYRSTPLEEGMVFVLKPRTGDPETGGHMTVGDTVCVTASGARRLSQRSMAAIVAG
jgi:Xaa-Pro aminopeptidase